ncbi:PIR-like protein [Plasmodium gallinaceum]|uniref:PIR-like protein n=1 Tax=Plasmodium gallinaceum TaxID=5849 RepID=A0A1J1GWB5_PLAGA|nr:PIR-like protein [Plasmodium gallinaceum]CRG96550.1 PIR-like protein [Plasmodium gallinaceum]
MMIIYIYLLVCIFQYFYSINFEVGKNNLKTELYRRSGRILAEQQQGTSSRRVRSASSIESLFKIWLESFEGEFFDELSKLTKNFTAENAQNFLDSMYKRGGIITKTLNLRPDLDEKSFLNNALTSWRKFSKDVLLDSAIGSYVDSLFNTENITTNNTGLSSALPSTSTSLPIATETFNETILPISTPSPELTISPTALPSASDLSTTADLSPTTSDSHINFTTSSTNDMSDLPTVFSTSGMNNNTTIMNNSTALTPADQGSGLSNAACAGLLCGPTFAALPVSLVLLGGVFFFVLLYMYTPVGKFLGRDNPKKKKAKKRLNEIPMECINSPQLLKVKKKENAKRSVLDRFLRAFGYDKNFPYIDEEIASDQVI